MTVREKLAALREKMAAYKLDIYLIGSEDFHGSEYVGEHFKCPCDTGFCRTLDRRQIFSSGGGTASGYRDRIVQDGQ